MSNSILLISGEIDTVSGEFTQIPWGIYLGHFWTGSLIFDIVEVIDSVSDYVLKRLYLVFPLVVKSS